MSARLAVHLPPHQLPELQRAARALLRSPLLTARDDENFRMLSDGRRMTIIVDTAGESTEESDILELIKDSWREIGIDMFVKPSQREVFRDRVFAGDSIMSVFFGVDNGLPNADMSPQEFAPSTQQQLMWPKWGQYIETAGMNGTPIDLPGLRELAAQLVPTQGGQVVVHPADRVDADAYVPGHGRWSFLAAT